MGRGQCSGARASPVFCADTRCVLLARSCLPRCQASAQTGLSFHLHSGGDKPSFTGQETLLIYGPSYKGLRISSKLFSCIEFHTNPPAPHTRTRTRAHTHMHAHPPQHKCPSCRDVAFLIKLIFLETQASLDWHQSLGLRSVPSSWDKPPLPHGTSLSWRCTCFPVPEGRKGTRCLLGLRSSFRTQRVAAAPAQGCLPWQNAQRAPRKQSRLAPRTPCSRQRTQEHSGSSGRAKARTQTGARAFLREEPFPWHTF